MFKVLFRVILIMMLTASVSTAKVKRIMLDDLPGEADFVVEGTVTDMSTRWDERRIMIFTDYTIEVSETILGKSQSTMLLSVAGGTVNGHTITVTDTPKLEVGKKYILFSYENNKYSIPFVGHEQGVFNVVQDKVKNEEYIVDYNGYRIERTDTKKMIRGPLSKINEKGELVKRKMVTKKPASSASTFEILDIHGDVVPQDKSPFAPPKARAPSSPVTRSEFIKFIQTQTNNKDAKRCR